MQETFKTITNPETAVFVTFIIIISLAGLLIAFIMLYQKKRLLHQEEINNIQELYNQALLQSKVEIQEQTLQEVASELHDNFTPTLSIINLNLASIAKKTEEPVKSDVIETKEMVKDLANDMKQMSVDLNSEHISKTGFVPALESHLRKIEKTGVYQIGFLMDGILPDLSPNSSLVLFRICQEALNNIVKHAGATQINVLLQTNENACTITISDNGSGFDIKTAEQNREDKESTGLLNMQRRAAAIGADLQVSSKPGQGTHITILLNA